MTSPGWIALAALAQEPLALKPSAPFRGELDPGAHARQDFSVRVPDGSVFLRVRLVTHSGEVELFGGPGDKPADVEQAPLRSDPEASALEVIADRLSDPPIDRGPWWFSVQCPDGGSPGSGDPARARRAYTLELNVIGARTDAKLAAGTTQHFTLDPASGGFRTFRIDVPEGAPALRIDLHGVPANLDVFAHRGSPLTRLAAADARACHDWGAETLLITAGGQPALASGEWYVDVMDALSANVRAPFDIRVAFGAEPPPEWSAPPVLAPREPQKPLSRALCAVLEVFTPLGGGSATLLSESGLAVTNAHVVDRGDRQPVDEIVLAANLDSRRPAEEAFRGTVVRFDAELDLALIQIGRGFYGNALPAGYRFPTVEIASGAPLEIGDPLWIVGYPSLGGTGSRVSIHCAHGVLSGFDQEDAGLVFKTDAAVISGNSGGAALDEHGRLIGVPSANVSDESSGLVGLVTPISLLPEEWRNLLR